MNCHGDQLQTPSSAPAASPSQLLHSDLAHASAATVSISPETYARLLSLADQAPLECLPLTSRTLARAKTLGYNQIGQIRSAPDSRLFADLGEDRAEELQRALYDFGVRPMHSGELSG
jgi:hypothetical protein